MRLFEIKSDLVYHVTHTIYVDSIKANGLQPRGSASNWVKAGSGERYGDGEIYLFTHPADAKKWAMSMDWEFNKELGSGNISIITLEKPVDGHDWVDDENDPLEVMTRNGPAIKTTRPVGPAHIVSVEPFTQASLKS